MQVKHASRKILTTFALCAGQAAAAEPVCLIAGWENPLSVCASHTRTLAATCFICHGPNGKSTVAVPPLAGQDKTYLLTALREYRDGTRESTVMKKYALGYTDSEYAEIAEFFSAIK